MTTSKELNSLRKLASILVAVSYLITVLGGFIAGHAFASSDIDTDTDTHCKMVADTHQSKGCGAANNKESTNHHDNCGDMFCDYFCAMACGLALPNALEKFPNVLHTNKFTALQDSSTQTSPGFPDRPPRA